jgi:hypothetical protein
MYKLNLLKTVKPLRAGPKPAKSPPAEDWTPEDLKFAKAVGIDLGVLGRLNEEGEKGGA